MLLYTQGQKHELGDNVLSLLAWDIKKSLLLNNEKQETLYLRTHTIYENNASLLPPPSTLGETVQGSVTDGEDQTGSAECWSYLQVKLFPRICGFEYCIVTPCKNGQEALIINSKVLAGLGGAHL